MLAQLSLDYAGSRVREATQVLVSKHPDLMRRTTSKPSSREDEDWVTAEDEIKVAEAWASTTKQSRGFWIRRSQQSEVWLPLYALYLVAAWSIGLLLLVTLGKILSNMDLALSGADGSE